MRELLLYFSVKYHGNWDQIYEAISKHEVVDKDKRDEYVSIYKDRYITILDDDYPTELKAINKPPFVIYYKGDKNLLYKENKIFPLTAQKKEEKELTKVENKINVKRMITVSGYSSLYERDLLEKTNTPKIIVKDGGIDNTLIITRPLEDKLLREGNLIISEYPSYVIPSKQNWLDSNRIKVGLSESMLLLSSTKEKSLWDMIYMSLQLRKRVYCIYGEDDKNFNNELIKHGAIGINDILEMKTGE